MRTAIIGVLQVSHANAWANSSCAQQLFFDAFCGELIFNFESQSVWVWINCLLLVDERELESEKEKFFAPSVVGFYLEFRRYARIFPNSDQLFFTNAVPLCAFGVRAIIAN